LRISTTRPLKQNSVI